MIILVNNNQIDLPIEISTLADFVAWKNIPLQATAIALNGKLIKTEKWSVTPLANMDNILVISAAFGG
ncbi:MAG: sulfur carrier protein ThiS [Muribaculaceae bacterium]|nr:sulfur carrier protein ThiS [Muribaculaceae bacterium]